MEAFFVLLAILAVGAVLIVPVVILVQLADLRRRAQTIQDEQAGLLADVQALRRQLEQDPAPPAVFATALPVAAPPVPPPEPAAPTPTPPLRAAGPLPPPLPQAVAVPITPPATLTAASVAAGPRVSLTFPTKPTAEPPAIAEPPEADECRPRPAIVETVREGLAKIWNWLLVNEEFRPRGVSTEYAVASVWLLRVGVVALVAASGYFLKLSMDKGWMGKEARVAIITFAGLAMAVGGLRLLGRRYHLIGQGLLGGGIALLYGSAYASAPLYHLVPMPVAFGLMFLVTVASGVLAVRVNSLLIGLLGLVGGYLTPVLLHTGEVRLEAFYAYLLLLSLGVLGVARYRQWRLLYYVSFVFTYVLFSLSLRDYEQARHFPAAMGFITAFFVIHSAILYVRHIVRAQTSTLLEVLHLLVNAAVFAGFGYGLIDQRFGRPYPALLSLGAAIFFMLQVATCIRRRLVDRGLLISLLALAAGCTAWTLPLVFEKETLTISLAILSATLLWLGGRMDSNVLILLARLAYAVVFYRVLLLELPHAYNRLPTNVPLAVYGKGLLDRLWVFGSAIASAVIGFYLQRCRPPRSEGVAPASGNDVADPLGDGPMRSVLYGAAVVMIFLCLHLELNGVFHYWEPLRLPMLTILWCGMAAYFMWEYVSGRGGKVFLGAATLFGAAALVKLLTWDCNAWGLNELGFFAMESYSLQYACMRFLDFGTVGLLFLGLWRAGRGGARAPGLAAAFGYGSLGMLFLFASLELNTFLHVRLATFQAAGISILWALFAVGFLVGGIWSNVRPLRFAGLLLFAVVGFKVMVRDLAHMEMVYKVIAFMVIGAALLIGSFVYIRFSRRFITGAEEQQS